MMVIGWGVTKRVKNGVLLLWGGFVFVFLFFVFCFGACNPSYYETGVSRLGPLVISCISMAQYTSIE